MHKDEEHRSALERSAVDALQCEKDRIRRRQSRGNPYVRIPLVLLAAAGSALAAPVAIVWTWLKERRAEQEVPPVRLGDGSLAPEQVPITIIPLGDLERFGLRVPKDAGKRFVLLTPACYKAAITKPVGESSDNTFVALTVPGQEHLRQVPAGFVTDFASIPWFLRRTLGHPASRFGRPLSFMTGHTHTTTMAAGKGGKMLTSRCSA